MNIKIHNKTQKSLSAKSIALKSVIIYAIAIINLQAQNSMVTIIVKPLVSPPESAAVCITGNHPSLGNWNPSGAKLKKENDGTWKIKLNIEQNYELEYKFTCGSWATEACAVNGSIPGNSILKVAGDTVINVTIPNWRNNFTVDDHLAITGDVEYIRGIEGGGIKPRDIIIWLPPDYKKEKNKRYPVLYMHDGQNVFDPKTSAFGVDWQADETADSLIKQNRLKKIIIVGIYNTRDRDSEYSYTELGRNYMNFIVKKLKPLIDKKYRTIKDRAHTATMGSSMGGLISFMLAWEHGDVFSMAACLSPAFKVDDINYLPFIKNYKGKKKPLKIYIDDGSIGLEKKLLPGVKETIELMEQKGYKTGEDLMWYYDENAEHNEKAWAARLWKPLLFMFGK